MPNGNPGHKIKTQPLNTYGSLHESIQALRENRPLDLTAENWREANPDGTFDQWREQVQNLLRDGLHHAPVDCDLNARTVKTIDRGEFIQEFIEFDSTPWFRLEGCFLLPKNATGPVPALVVFHAWGGPIIFGKERIVNVGRDPPMLLEHRNKLYSGNYLAEEFAKQGYAVIVVDAFHFGCRAPRGLGDLPEQYDPFDLAIRDSVFVCEETVAQLYFGVRQLNWAGTTWAGVNFIDDSRCIDYLLSRPEVDASRIGCTGVSGGGWRTNILAALDERVKASCSVGWMTIGNYQQAYNLAGGVGTFNLLPGVWTHIDIPDLTIMTAPKASMIVLSEKDILFPNEAKAEAYRQIAEGFEWAGCSDMFSYYSPPVVHCYDTDIQEKAVGWFDKHLKG